MLFSNYSDEIKGLGVGILIYILYFYLITESYIEDNSVMLFGVYSFGGYL